VVCAVLDKEMQFPSNFQQKDLRFDLYISLTISKSLSSEGPSGIFSYSPWVTTIGGVLYLRFKQNHFEMTRAEKEKERNK
jgi:hypothetical protein